MRRTLEFYYQLEAEGTNILEMAFTPATPETTASAKYIIGNKKLYDKNTDQEKGHVTYDYIDFDNQVPIPFHIAMNRITLTFPDGSLTGFGTKREQFTPLNGYSYYTIVAGNGIYEGIRKGSIVVFRSSENRRDVTVRLPCRYL